MKKTDPSIQLVGCTHFGKENWNKTMINEAGDLLNLFSVHDYLLDHYKGDLPGIAKAPTERLRPLLENACKSLQLYIPKNQYFTITLDEWNTIWGLPGSVSMGLYTAGVLNLLCREAANLKVSRAYYFMPVNEGAIKVTPLGSELDPAGEVFAFYAPHQGNRLLNASVMSADANTDQCASITPDKKNIYVTVVNRNATSSCTIEFSLSNFTGPAKATAKLLVPVVSDVDGRLIKVDKKLKVTDGQKVSLQIPPFSVVRIHFGSPKSD